MRANTAMVLIAAMSLSAPAMAADKSPPDAKPAADPQQNENAASELRKAGKHIGNAANDAAKTSKGKLRKIGKTISEETRPAEEKLKRGINKLVPKPDRATRPNTTKVEPKTEVAPPAKPASP